jgi:hypothetical protein
VPLGPEQDSDGSSLAWPQPVARSNGRVRFASLLEDAAAGAGTQRPPTANKPALVSELARVASSVVSSYKDAPSSKRRAVVGVHDWMARISDTVASRSRPRVS